MAQALAQPVEPVYGLAQQDKPALVSTLNDLVSIESISRDFEGLDKIANLIAERLRALGGKVELLESNRDVYKMFDTPEAIGKMVHARFEGTGTRKILLIAHTDTVYLVGMSAKQPFRIEGNRAYGLGISDDKQGIAVILHTLAMLKAMNFKDYGQITVLINADEEISSPGSRATLTQLGAEHDAVFSLEGSRAESDRLSLAIGRCAGPQPRPFRFRRGRHDELLRMLDQAAAEVGLRPLRPHLHRRVAIGATRGFDQVLAALDLRVARQSGGRGPGRHRHHIQQRAG